MFRAPDECPRPRHLLWPAAQQDGRAGEGPRQRWEAHRAASRKHSTNRRAQPRARFQLIRSEAPIRRARPATWRARARLFLAAAVRRSPFAGRRPPRSRVQSDRTRNLQLVAAPGNLPRSPGRPAVLPGGVRGRAPWPGRDRSAPREFWHFRPAAEAKKERSHARSLASGPVRNGAGAGAAAAKEASRKFITCNQFN